MIRQWETAMQIVPLSPEHERAYCLCLEDWSDEVKEARPPNRMPVSSGAAFREWGEPDAIFVDGKGLRMGPPPSYEKIRKAIARRVKKLDRGG
jgi:hypothetical protein